MKKHIVLALAAPAASGTVVSAIAATPAETVAARQANFKQLGRAMKAIGEELKKPAPDLGVIRASAQSLNQAAGHVGHGFPRGSGPESGVKTEALAAIWQRPADFQGATRNLVTKAGDLRAAATSGDLNRIRTAFPAVGGACKGCHDNFRERH